MTNDDLTVFRERNTRKRLSNAAALIGKADDAVFEACRPTGYAELDRCLGGGLTAGLHCLGAVPSLGKSTYVMQMGTNGSRGDPCDCDFPGNEARGSGGKGCQQAASVSYTHLDEMVI